MEVQDSRLIGRPCSRRWRSITGARWTIFGGARKCHRRSGAFGGGSALPDADPRGRKLRRRLTGRCGDPPRERRRETAKSGNGTMRTRPYG